MQGHLGSADLIPTLRARALYGRHVADPMTMLAQAQVLVPRNPQAALTCMENKRSPYKERTPITRPLMLVVQLVATQPHQHTLIMLVPEKC